MGKSGPDLHSGQVVEQACANSRRADPQHGKKSGRLASWLLGRPTFRPSARPRVRSIVRVIVRASDQSSDHPCERSFVCSFVRSSVRPLVVRPFVRPSNRSLYNRPFGRPYVRLPARSSVRPSRIRTNPRTRSLFIDQSLVRAHARALVRSPVRPLLWFRNMTRAHVKAIAWSESSPPMIKIDDFRNRASKQKQIVSLA